MLPPNVTATLVFDCCDATSIIGNYAIPRNVVRSFFYIDQTTALTVEPKAMSLRLWVRTSSLPGLIEWFIVGSGEYPAHHFRNDIYARSQAIHHAFGELQLETNATSEPITPFTDMDPALIPRLTLHDMFISI
jgi:hypothetical protein